MRDITAVCFIHYRRKSVVVKTNLLQKELARSESVGEVRECWRGLRVLARSERVGEATTCRQRHTMLVNSECSRVHTVLTMSESLGWSQTVGEIV